MKFYIKMYRIMTYLKITMSNLKEEIQAVTMKMNQMRNQPKKLLKRKKKYQIIKNLKKKNQNHLKLRYV